MKVRVKIPKNYVATERVEDLKPGDVAMDGSIYLGLYQDKDWFVTDKDGHDPARLYVHFNEAANYAKKLTAHGHNDWMLPPGREVGGEVDILTALYHHQETGAFKGTFYTDVAFNSAHSWYWSSSMQDGNRALQRGFRCGFSYWSMLNDSASVRCVRAVPRVKKR